MDLMGASNLRFARARRHSTKRSSMGKMKRGLALFCYLLIVTCSLLFSQTADRIEALFDTQELSYEQAAAFVLEAADMQMSNQADAFRYATERNWLPKNVEARDRARLDGVSLLVMKAFEIKGGAFYSVFQNVHYAYRELEYRNVIEGKTVPAMAVSGEMMLFIVGRVLSE